MQKQLMAMIVAIIMILVLSTSAFADNDSNDPSTWVVVECTGPANENEQTPPAAVEPSDPSTWVVVECTGPANENEQTPPAAVEPNDPSTWVVVECTGPAHEEGQALPAMENAPQSGTGTTYTTPATGNTNNYYLNSSISAVNPTANNVIIVRQIEGLSADEGSITLSSADESSITLSSADYIALNEEELNEYYGINIFPTVPDEIKVWDDQQYGIYKENGGTGDVYWDGSTLNYSNEDFTKTLNVEVKKDSLPLCDYELLSADEENSIINNVDVAIAQSENGYYFAQFVYSDVGFQLTAKGLTQEEFVATISSLIK